MREVPAAEFTRNFGQYREIVQREPVAVTSDGQATGYFVSVVEYEELQRLRALARHSRAVIDLTQQDVELMVGSRMAAEHDHLNALLDED